MAENKQQGHGLVKKLFFPGYADAGANENFGASHQGDGGASESDAATAILDNRTASKPQQHEIQYDGGKVGDFAPATAAATRVLDSSLLTETGMKYESFSSMDAPSSPLLEIPSQQRLGLGSRSASTTTQSGIRPFPTTSPRVGIPARDPSLSRSLVTESSAAFSSVVGESFLYEESNAGESQLHDDSGEKDPTPLRDNRSNGPGLTLQRLADLNNSTGSEVISDVNSTASEMGTVVGAPGRLADVQAMAALMEQNDSPALRVEEWKMGRLPAGDVPELSLPLLEERRSSELLVEEPKDGDRASHVFRARVEPSPLQDSPSASELVSAAVRRLGSVGSCRQAPLQKSPSNARGSNSAPATPRVVPASPRVEDYLRSSFPTRSTEHSESVAILLRSPGSAAHFQADGSRVRDKPALAPRFSHRLDRGSIRVEGGVSYRPAFRHANSLSSPLRFARGCISFDNTLDEVQLIDDRFALPERRQPRSPLLRYRKRANPPQSPSQPKVVQSRSWDASSSASSLQAQIQETPRTPLGYRAFSFGKSPDSPMTAPDAFRPTPFSRVRNANGLSIQSKPAERFVAKNLNDISPTIANADDHNTLALRTPQRIEIEREDALDILSCLVERSVAFDQELAISLRVHTIQEAEEENDGRGDGAEITVVSGASQAGEKKAESADDDRISTFADIGVRDAESPDVLQSPPKGRRASASSTLEADAFSSDITESIRMIQRISQDYERNTSQGSRLETEDISHSMRMKAIDELLKSHTYAAEMRRAAKSASTWLRSLDRSDASSDENNQDMNIKIDLSVAESAHGENHEAQNELEKRANQSAGEQQESELQRTDDTMDIVALKAILHSWQVKAKENEDLSARLNEELSNCRAEIGRLKSASRAEIVFASPNRSILDNDDDSMSAATETAGVDGLDEVLDGASPIPRADTERDSSIEASFIRSDVLLERKAAKDSEEWSALANAKQDAVLLKAALSQANDTIRRLHKESTLNTGNDSMDAPIVSIDNPELSKELDDYKEAIRKANISEPRGGMQESSCAGKDASKSPGVSDRRTVNVRMIDGENFVTEWDELVPSLPPPPDHGLRSPIVAALLWQWTSDRSMHDSLISWMERIIGGARPETVPPLTISSLDHQVRDGFAMHVLPLLLRRHDIRVDVKTRAHRRTNYDLSVSVTRCQKSEQGHTLSSEPSEASAESTKKAQMMAFQASHGNQAILDESMLAHVGAPTVSDYLRATGVARHFDVGSSSVAHSASTALVTNSSSGKHFAGNSRRSRTAGHDRNEPPTGNNSPGRTVDRDSAEMIGPFSRAMLGDDISTSSSTSDGSSERSTPQSGLMRSIGGAFGGLLRRKPTEASSHPGDYDDDSHPIQETDSVPRFLRHVPPSSPARGEEDGHPYHRVVSAPPGRIGVTFVEYRGHAMVSDVAAESPLSGWVFPSDILIAIDEVPVSGMRVREIVKVLTSRKERQRALRVISSHAMNEFTLNTTTPSEIGAPS